MIMIRKAKKDDMLKDVNGCLRRAYESFYRYDAAQHEGLFEKTALLEDAGLKNHARAIVYEINDLLSLLVEINI